MWHLLMLLGVALLAPTGRALVCTRRPANTLALKSPVDENYVISITGNPETYILGQEYNGERVSSLALRLNFNILRAPSLRQLRFRVRRGLIENNRQDH